MGQKSKFPQWKDEASTISFRQSVVAEFIATFLFLFCTIGCVVFTQDGGITTARQTEVALVFGALITVLVFIFAGISGANINPAVSLGLAVAGKISPFRAGMYTIAQCLGAVCGAGLVRIMTPALFDKVDGGANEIGRNATAKEALGVEFGCTMLLVLTVMAAVDTKRAEKNKHIQAIAPMVVGQAVTAGHYVAIPVDSCSINPARSFGVSVISGNFNDHWVFWMGPYLGAIAAALVYNYLFSYQEEADAPLPPPKTLTIAAAAAVPTPAAAMVSPAAAVTQSALFSGSSGAAAASDAAVGLSASAAASESTVEFTAGAGGAYASTGAVSNTQVWR